jgi:hypothetical protein
MTSSNHQHHHYKSLWILPTIMSVLLILTGSCAVLNAPSRRTALTFPAEISVITPLKIEIYFDNDWYSLRGTCVEVGQLNDLQVYSQSSYYDKIVGLPIGMWQPVSGASLTMRGSCHKVGEVLFEKEVLQLDKIRTHNTIYFFVYLTSATGTMTAETTLFELGNNGVLYPDSR